MQRRYTLVHLILPSVIVFGLALLMACVDAQAQISFMSHRDGNWEIYVMDADGDSQRNLTNNPDDDLFPLWSPDGKRIAFVSTRTGNSEIYVMDANGRKQRNLTNDRDNDRSPSWSPDGKRIAFVSERNGNLDLYVMDDDGGNPQNLTNNRHAAYSPAWYNPVLSVAPAGKTLTIWGWLKQVGR